MAISVGAFEAKTHLSELLTRVEAGEVVTITKHGRPVARLVPARDAAMPRDWAEFWRGVDQDLVDLPKATPIKGDIEAGRL